MKGVPEGKDIGVDVQAQLAPWGGDEHDPMIHGVSWGGMGASKGLAHSLGNASTPEVFLVAGMGFWGVPDDGIGNVGFACAFTFAVIASLAHGFVFSWASLMRRSISLSISVRNSHERISHQSISFPWVDAHQRMSLLVVMKP